MPSLPRSPLDFLLAGLRTDADLLRRLLKVCPTEERASLEGVLADIKSQIRILEDTKRAAFRVN
jgi:hypothetical protein